MKKVKLNMVLSNLRFMKLYINEENKEEYFKENLPIVLSVIGEVNFNSSQNGDYVLFLRMPLFIKNGGFYSPYYKFRDVDDLENLFDYLDEYKFYNCNKETGLGLKYYIINN